jgi:hypothetical protein
MVIREWQQLTVRMIFYFQGHVLEKDSLHDGVRVTLLPIFCRGSSQCESYGLSFTTLDEPPSADPHARWCGEGGLETRPYPIGTSFAVSHS